MSESALTLLVHEDDLDEWSTAWGYTLCMSVDPDGWAVPWGTGWCPLLVMADPNHMPTPVMTLDQGQMPEILAHIDDNSLALVRATIEAPAALAVIVEGKGRSYATDEVAQMAAEQHDYLSDPGADTVRVLLGLHPHGGYVVCHHSKGTQEVRAARLTRMEDYPGFTESDLELVSNLALLARELGC